MINNVMEKKEPLVTIVSGYFNRENQVTHSLLSLVNQSYSNLEILIFDDCSTDGTLDKLNLIAAKDNRMKIIKHSYNKGFVQGVIDAIKISTGEFIAIHGSGDISLKDRIFKQVNYLYKNSSISIVGCHYHNIRNGKIIETIRESNNGVFKERIRKKNIFSHGEVIFRKSTYDKVGGYRTFFQYSQDYDLWCRMSLISEYYVIQEILYERNNDSKNAVSNSALKLVRQAILEDFINQSFKLRQKYGYDYIDFLGNQALAFRKRSLKLSLKIVYKYLLGDNVLGSNEDLNKVWAIVKSDKFSIAKVLLYLIRLKIVSSKKTFQLIRLLIKIIGHK